MGKDAAANDVAEEGRNIKFAGIRKAIFEADDERGESFWAKMYEYPSSLHGKRQLDFNLSPRMPLPANQSHFLSTFAALSWTDRQQSEKQSCQLN